MVIENENAINYSFRENVPENEIVSTGYLTHGIYPYPAKFIPHVPYYVIKKFLKENGNNKIILDPFAGSSTTAVEAINSNNNCIVMDNNPILDLLSKAKTMDIDFKIQKRTDVEKSIFDYLDVNFEETENVIHLDNLINDIKRCEKLFRPNWSNIDHWVEREFQNDLMRIWGYIHFESEKPRRVTPYSVQTTLI